MTPPAPDALPQRGATGTNVPSKRPLFRREVIEFQRHNRQWGRVVPLQPLSTRLMVWCCRRHGPGDRLPVLRAIRPQGDARATSRQRPAPRRSSQRGGNHQRRLCRAGAAGRAGQPLLAVTTARSMPAVRTSTPQYSAPCSSRNSPCPVRSPMRCSARNPNGNG